MALEISRDDPASRQRETTMAVQGTRAQERIYETVDGQLVREGDTRGAWLRYGLDDQIDAGDMDAYRKLTGVEGVTSRAYTDDEVRAQLALRQARPEPATVRPAVPQMHDRLATELADQQRRVANLPAEQRAEAMEEAVPEEVMFTAHEIWRTGDGRLVHRGDPTGERVAYAAGDRVQDGDAEHVKGLGDPPSPDSDGNGEDTGTGTKAQPAPANKAATASNKAASTRRAP